MKILFFILFCSISGVSECSSINQTVFQYVKKINYKIEKQKVDEIVDVSKRISEKWNIDQKIILAIISVESSFDQFAKSRSSYGLMQINKGVWYNRYKDKKYNLKKLGLITNAKEFWNIEKNINAGAYIFHTTREQCRTLHKNNLLKKRGYINLFQCTFQRYNGAPTNDLYYYRKIIGTLIELKYFNK